MTECTSRETRRSRGISAFSINFSAKTCPTVHLILYIQYKSVTNDNMCQFPFECGSLYQMRLFSPLFSEMRGDEREDKITQFLDVVP